MPPVLVPQIPPVYTGALPGYPLQIESHIAHKVTPDIFLRISSAFYVGITKHL